MVINKDLLDKITETLEKIAKIELDVRELKQKLINVALVEEDEVEVKDVFFVEEKEKSDMMILDLGACCSLFGKDWMEKWLEENGMSKGDLENVECKKKFHFGPGRTCVSKVQYTITLVIKRKDVSQYC